MDSEGFFGEIFGGALGGFFGLLLLLGFIGLIFVVIEIISNGATRATGKNPNSKEGSERATRIGIFLFVAFIFFALFIAPNLGDNR
jgi:uncharacterized BrkB/YihY/UPF0761 family membrane protein